MHDELDIQTTIVLLKALAKTGGGHSIEIPMSVRLAGNEGWRLAAIQFLDKAKLRRQYQERFVIPVLKELQAKQRREREDSYVELNERFDFEERKETGGKLYRELRTNT